MEGKINTMGRLTSTNFLVQIICNEQNIRSKNLINDLKCQGIKFHFAEAVFPNYKEFIEGSLNSKITSKLISQRNLTIGEVGCALAHRKTSSKLLTSESLYGITFEDDAEIMSYFDFEMLENKLKVDKPIVIVLGWQPGYGVLKTLPLEKKSQILELLTPPTCTFAYAYNKSAAKLLINENKKINDVADWPIEIFDKIKFYLVSPPWVKASSDLSNSLIGERIFNKNSNLLRRLVKKIQLIFNLLALMFIALSSKHNFTIRQVVHRVILRDQIFNRSSFVSTDYPNLSILKRPYRSILNLLHF